MFYFTVAPSRYSDDIFIKKQVFYTFIEYTRLYSSISEVLFYTVEPHIICNDVFLHFIITSEKDVPILVLNIVCKTSSFLLCYIMLRCFCLLSRHYCKQQHILITLQAFKFTLFQYFSIISNPTLTFISCSNISALSTAILLCLSIFFI